MQQSDSIPIYLNIYDFTSLNCCLSTLGIGGYHTAIEIKEIEFCYSVISSDPDESGIFGIEPESAQYSFNRKMYLGQSELPHKKILKIIDDLALKYTCGKYHMFKNNCNHFSNELAQLILGKELPRQFFRITDFLGKICCLPQKIVNGQYAFAMLYGVEEESLKEQQKMIEKLISEGNKK